MAQELTRRKAIWNAVSGSALALSGIGNVSASRTNESISDFDPHDLDSIRKVWEAFEERNTEGKIEILDKLSGDQEEAFFDAGRERYKIYEQELERGSEEHAAGKQIIENNRYIAEKWDWDLPPTKAEAGLMESKQDVTIQQDPYCDNGGSNYNTSITSESYFGSLRYTWAFEIEWDWSYCSDGAGVTYDNDVSNGDYDDEIVETGTGWRYDGVDFQDDGYDETRAGNPIYRAEMSVKFSHFDGTYAPEFPTIELIGRSTGAGETVNSEIRN